jgi:16S rRNA (cytosine1402-N4)-methyltransferase
MTEPKDRPHIPVMLRQSLDMLNVQPGKLYVDATAGAGGHLREIAKRTGDGGRVIGIDQDLNSVQTLNETLQAEGFKNAKVVHSNFRDIKQVLGSLDIATVDGGILADLGVSSMQLDIPERGFSFMKEGPLDMRMDPTAAVDAEQLINKLPEKELADIIYRYGEERLSRQIARRIVEARPLKTTTELAAVVSRVVGPKRKQGRNRDESHPATRTFQALRMAVNDELGSIEQFIDESISVMSPEARLVLITFHSLEDRLVKQNLRQAASPCICPPRFPICTCNKKPTLKILTGKPLLPDEEEVLANPRSRSAKLRAGEKVS